MWRGLSMQPPSIENRRHLATGQQNILLYLAVGVEGQAVSYLDVMPLPIAQHAHAGQADLRPTSTKHNTRSQSTLTHRAQMLTPSIPRPTSLSTRRPTRQAALERQQRVGCARCRAPRGRLVSRPGLPLCVGPSCPVASGQGLLLFDLCTHACSPRTPAAHTHCTALRAIFAHRDTTSTCTTCLRLKLTHGRAKRGPSIG
jgi:hypothetical protein